MSQPTKSGELLTVAVDSLAVARVTNDPGFTSLTAPDVPHRALAIFRHPLSGFIGWETWYGRDLGLSRDSIRTVQGDRWSGYFDTRDALAAARFSLERGYHYLFRLWGGADYSYGPQGDDPGKYVEWGLWDVKGNPNEVELELSAVPAPPPPAAQPNAPAAIAELENVVIPAIVRLEGSDAYKRNFRNVVTGTNQARGGVEAALAFLHGQP